MIKASRFIAFISIASLLICFVEPKIIIQDQNEFLSYEQTETDFYANEFLEHGRSVLENDFASDTEQSTKENKNASVPISFVEKLDTTQFEDKIAALRVSYGIKSDAEIEIHSFSSSNKFQAHGKQFSLNGLKGVNIIKEGATYMHDNVGKEIPPINVYQMEDADEMVIVTKEPDGYIKRISIINKNDGRSTEITSVLPGIYATIEDTDIDMDLLNEKFELADMNEGYEGLKAKISDLFGKFRHREQRRLQEDECSHYNVIELAVAYDSSFCKESGGTEEGAVNEVASIVAGVDQKYQQPGLCARVVLSHLEGYCDDKIDPYEEIVNIGFTGCDCEEPGAMDAFKEYWENNRSDIKRDVAHLFSGTSLECTVGCKIGCAWIRGLCTGHAYGVNHATYSSSADLRSVLVAHEIGHNVGADHTQSGYIMYSNIQYSPYGFTNSSQQLMLDNMEKRGCTDSCASDSCCVLDSECDNGLFCDGIETCDKYECSKSISPCDDGDVCTEDICDEGSESCRNIPIPGCCKFDSECGNNLYCDGVDLCLNNICTTLPEPCDDGDPCTIDDCDELTTSCTHTLITGPFCEVPSSQPSLAPFSSPSALPTLAPSMEPTGIQPSTEPSGIPSYEPSVKQTSEPSSLPTFTVSDSPSSIPTVECVEDSDCDNDIFCDGIEKCIDGSCEYADSLRCDDGDECTYNVCREHFDECVFIPKNNCYPTSSPSSMPSQLSSIAPSFSITPSLTPSRKASVHPTSQPSKIRSSIPSEIPFANPSAQPSQISSSLPSEIPFANPSAQPSQIHSSIPSEIPFSNPSSQPSEMSSRIPSEMPS